MIKKYFILCLFIFVCTLSGQNNNKYKNLDWYIFHSLNWKDYIDYKSEEWKNISTAEKMSFFQIPSKELQKMNTISLIEASINSYFARGIGKYSTINDYYKEIYDNFNGFRELTKRKNIGIQLINYYDKLNVKTKVLSKWGLSIKEQIQNLEFLIGHPEIITKLSRNEVDKLFYLLKEKYLIKKNFYNEKDVVSNIYALARMLERKNSNIKEKLYSVDKINIFLGTGIFLPKITCEQILNICSEL